MISNDLKETILCSIAADRNRDRSLIVPLSWEFWAAGTFTLRPAHIGNVECTYNGYNKAVYGFDHNGNIELYAD